jgi:hypothetical protein
VSALGILLDLRSARTGTTDTTLMLARRMDTTVLIGLWVECSLALAPGTTDIGGMAGTAAPDIGAAVTTAAQDGATDAAAMDIGATDMAMPTGFMATVDSMEAEASMVAAVEFTVVVASMEAGAAKQIRNV